MPLIAGEARGERARTRGVTVRKAPQPARLTARHRPAPGPSATKHLLIDTVSCGTRHREPGIGSAPELAAAVVAAAQQLVPHSVAEERRGAGVDRLGVADHDRLALVGELTVDHACVVRGP